MRWPLHIGNKQLTRCGVVIAALSLPLLAVEPSRGHFDPRHELKGDALFRALKDGGYTLLCRHTSRVTNRTESNDKIVLNDCSTQLPLTEHGRAQARAAGAAMRQLGIPLGETIASPFCRTMETARLIAGDARADDAVLGHVDGSFQNPMDFTRLRKILATPPPPGTNRLVVGHSSAFDNIGSEPSLEEGECGIFKIVDRRPVQVGRVLIEEWQAYLSSRKK